MTTGEGGVVRVVPLRLGPGCELHACLLELLVEQQVTAGWLLSGIGSLSTAQLRLAGQEAITTYQGELEILTLAGSLCADGAHLHISVADRQGIVTGGHLGTGSLVRTTAELLVALLPQWSFSRELDASSGWRELVIEAAEGGNPEPMPPDQGDGRAGEQG
ncbi:MAG: PPC domain-containing DNA-binding protein [Synechococcaceae cyanobacterium ELA263]